MNMQLFVYNPDAIKLILSGIFSLLLAVIIKWTNNQKKFDNAKRSIEKQIENDSYLMYKYGNIDDYLNRDPEFKKLNFLDELAANTLRPMLLLALLNSVFIYFHIGLIVFSFFLVLLSFPHEMHFSQKRMKYSYMFFVLFLWIPLYMILSHKYNSIDLNNNLASNKVAVESSKSNSDSLSSKALKLIPNPKKIISVSRQIKEFKLQGRVTDYNSNSIENLNILICNNSLKIKLETKTIDKGFFYASFQSDLDSIVFNIKVKKSDSIIKEYNRLFINGQTTKFFYE